MSEATRLTEVFGVSEDGRFAAAYYEGGKLHVGFCQAHELGAIATITTSHGSYSCDHVIMEEHRDSMLGILYMLRNSLPVIPDNDFLVSIISEDALSVEVSVWFKNLDNNIYDIRKGKYNLEQWGCDVSPDFLDGLEAFWGDTTSGLSDHLNGSNLKGEVSEQNVFKRVTIGDMLNRQDVHLTVCKHSWELMHNDEFLDYIF